MTSFDEGDAFLRRPTAEQLEQQRILQAAQKAGAASLQEVRDMHNDDIAYDYPVGTIDTSDIEVL
jgi:hypothetical protein